MWVTKQLLVHVDFDSRENCGLATVWIPIKDTVLIYIVFYFSICSFRFLNALAKYTYCSLPENKTLFILFVYYMYL